MNLKTEVFSAKKEKRVPLILALLGLLTISLLLHHLDIPLSAPRPLEVDERETVVTVLERIEEDTPALLPWAEAFKKKLLEQEVPAYWGSVKKNHGVQITKEGFFFSPTFFSADPIEQENQLAQTLTSVHAKPKIMDEIAVSPE